MTKAFNIGGTSAGTPYAPFVIAEIGVNHGGSMDLAKRLIDEVAEGGAHAAKFQTYKADKLASKNSAAYWDQTKEPTDSQYKLFKKFDSFEESDYIELAEHCKKVGVHFMSTPFDLEAVDFLAPIMPVFKVASADITNVPLLRRIASHRKPVVMSTGASTLPEIANAVLTLRSAGAQDIGLLHCVLNYPTPEENAQLGMIEVLRQAFPDCAIGYSDHVVPDETISALEAAMLMGCTILEKHFTHDKTLQGNDHYHAMNQEDLARFMAKADTYRTLIGQGTKDLSLEAEARKHARRSIIAARTIKAGEILSDDNLIIKRPGIGISPLHWDEIVGRTAVSDIEDDELLKWSDVE